MNKQALILCIISIMCTSIYAQTDTTLGNVVEQQLENLAETEEMETEDDSYLQSLMQFRRNPLNLNTAEQSDLRELKLLNDLQIANLFRYRRLLGNLISIYELQAIPTWDVETIKRILPFIRVDNALPLGADLGKRLLEGRHTILFRAQQVLEKSKGFAASDSVANRYLGSPQRIFLRYKYSYRNLLQYGFVGDKDAGESFFKGNQNRGFDFYSFHLFVRKVGIVKALALGDYTVNLGQGLIHWQSLAFKKGPDVTAIKRQADVLRPYNSPGEVNFQRGAAITLEKANFQLTAFASIRKMDATINRDTFLTNEDYISSILNTGYHRTSTEISKRNAIEQTSFGGNVAYNKNSLHIGANGIGFNFSSPIQRTIQPYNQYAITGSNWHNYSVDYSYTYRNVHFFGEAAMDKNNAKAFVNGLLVSLHQTVDASVLYRNIEKSYQTLYGNAFTESTFPTNEKGLFTGISIKPSTGLKIDAYADVFSFPWLRFRVDAPSMGSDYFVQLTYRPNKQTEFYTRFRNESKSINLSGLDLPTRANYNRPKQDLRTQFSYKMNSRFTLRNRLEVLWYDPREKDRAEQGFLSYVDLIYKPLSEPISFNTRLQYFETEGFDSRIYAFENDVLYSYSIPAFSGKGFRYYLNVNVDLTKKLTLWARIAQTVYNDRNIVGSGLDEINGNQRTELKFQLQYLF